MESYLVLARKYRPQKFLDLIGQEYMVKALSNAFKTDRVAHSFLLTGIRGIGKTTTARVIAKAINCSAPVIGESYEPCNICSSCESITRGNHPDVLELDAASRTGVADIRELLEDLKYVPVQSKYKVYIIDEVHMLSTNAFNALLKNLEEPPAHAKFIFATTEIRKVPITIISRCQRYDLKRIENEILTEHLTKIAKLESIKIEKNALELISELAEGSVRDSLSLLDRVICLKHEQLDVETLKNILGIVSNIDNLNLLELILKGETKEALEYFRNLAKTGVQYNLLLEQLLEMCAQVASLKFTNKTSSNVFSDDELVKLRVLTENEVTKLTRLWQMILKGAESLKFANFKHSAFEMLIIRLCHGAMLPSPEDVLNDLKKKSSSQPRKPVNQNKVKVSSEAELLKLLEERNELMLYNNLTSEVEITSVSEGKIELRSVKEISSLKRKLEEFLKKATEKDWVILDQRTEQIESWSEKQEAIASNRLSMYKEDEFVKNILQKFPGTEMIALNSN